MLDRMALCLALASLATSIVTASAMAATTAADFAPSNAAIAGPSRVEAGAWRSKVQHVFDGRTRILSRRLYEVWDPEPSRDLDFQWTPDRPEFDRPGRINGHGHIAWRKKDLPSYSQGGMAAEYRGGMRDGRADGNGIYVDAGGFYYDGQWRRGLMHGQGTLKLPSGDEYVGTFRNGKADGRGRYIDITGEIFKGTFARGLRNGSGSTTLPNGAKYLSHWVEGQEAKPSRLIRLAQIGSKGAPDTSDDFRIGITISRRLPPRSPDEAPRPSKWDLWYAISNTPNGFAVLPDNVRLMNVWKGNGWIHPAPEYLGGEGDQYGVFGLDRSQLQPIMLSIEAHNRSVGTVQVTGAYLAVNESRTDRQPAIEINPSLGSTCKSGLFEAEFKLDNFGWSPAVNASMQFSFARPGQVPPNVAPRLAHRIGNIDKRANVNLESHLVAAGVNVAALKRYANGGFRCPSSDKAQCLEHIKSLVPLGMLAPLAILRDVSVEVHAAGLLDYQWRDASGKQHSRSSPIVVPITLGQLARSAECAEGGSPEVVISKTQQLRLDAFQYRLPVAFRADVPSGRTARYGLPIDAEKSSLHSFRVVMQLSDGREVASRPIHLIHYKPSWFAGDGPVEEVRP